ncbi:MAG TPA: hypothetical protein VEY69_08700 [Lautropia sp.]|nr:hypothetical protein [Lautropia sp.]
MTDTGEGIAADVQRSIFEPFYPSKPQGTSTSLGLPYSLGIVGAHGGHLELVEASSECSAFAVTPKPVGEAPAIAGIGADTNYSAASKSDISISGDGRLALLWRQVDGRGLLHMSRRVGESRSMPVALPSNVNVGPFNFKPALTDGKRLTYASTRGRDDQPASMADGNEVSTRDLFASVGPQ